MSKYGGSSISPNNRTQLNVQYHFDNAISLITGVFDTLALKTAEKYAIDDIRKEFISLSNNRGRDFLNEVREANTDLRDHIADHMAYINLVYVLRPLVVHRGGHQDSLLEDADQGWTAGVIPLDRFNEADRDAFERYYREIEDGGKQPENDCQHADFDLYLVGIDRFRSGVSRIEIR